MIGSFPFVFHALTCLVGGGAQGGTPHLRYSSTVYL